MKCETIDMNYLGKNFRDYVYSHDISSIERHYQEGRFILSYLKIEYTVFFSSDK